MGCRPGDSVSWSLGEWEVLAQLPTRRSGFRASLWLLFKRTLPDCPHIKFPGRNSPFGDNGFHFFQFLWHYPPSSRPTAFPLVRHEKPLELIWSIAPSNGDGVGEPVMSPCRVCHRNCVSRVTGLQTHVLINPSGSLLSPGTEAALRRNLTNKKTDGQREQISRFRREH